MYTLAALWAVCTHIHCVCDKAGQNCMYTQRGWINLYVSIHSVDGLIYMYTQRGWIDLYVSIHSVDGLIYMYTQRGWIDLYVSIHSVDGCNHSFCWALMYCRTSSSAKKVDDVQCHWDVLVPAEHSYIVKHQAVPSRWMMCSVIGTF